MNYAEWRSRDQEGREQLFRNAVRVNLDALTREGTRINELATTLLADALVETANRQGYFPLRPGTWHEQPFDYGNAQGLGGEIVAVFTATKDQFIRWLEYELEERARRILALEAGWGYRGWRVACRVWGHLVGGPRRVWRRIRPPGEE